MPSQKKHFPIDLFGKKKFNSLTVTCLSDKIVLVNRTREYLMMFRIYYFVYNILTLIDLYIFEYILFFLKFF